MYSAAAGAGAVTSRGGVKTYGRHGFTAQDIEASEILLSLRNLIHSSESRFRVSVQWGRKRKRSAIGSGPSPLLPEIFQKKVKASSPATPLSYPPSESDDKPMDRVRKISKKQTKEELKNTVNELEKEQQFLRRELEIVSGRRNQLVACNAYFKAKQLELIHGLKFPGTETPGELVMEKKEGTHDRHQRSGLVFPSFVGPVGIPDLNMTLEDVSRPLDCLMNIKDVKSAAAADARRKRMLRMKEKMKKSLISVKISSRC